MPPSGQGCESFLVDGQSFKYNDAAYNGGFEKSSLYGGPIREGLQVRIWYVDNVIVRLEIARNQ
jgi:hypothetical protein